MWDQDYHEWKVWDDLDQKMRYLPHFVQLKAKRIRVSGWDEKWKSHVTAQTMDEADRYICDYMMKRFARLEQSAS